MWRPETVLWEWRSLSTTWGSGGGTQVITFGCRRLVFVLTLLHRGAGNGKHTGLVIRRKGGVLVIHCPEGWEWTSLTAW